MPLICTLLLDDRAQEHVDALRRAHFPAERNHVAAHVTLFHALPDARAVVDDVAAAAAGQAPFPVRVTGLRDLGRGTAYALAAPELTALRRGLADQLDALLTAQDRRPYAPHVTVQNKVPPAQARALRAALAEGFAPYDVTAVGLGLWRYLGGPWEPVALSRFVLG